MLLTDGYGVKRHRAYLVEALMFLAYVCFTASWYAASRLTPEIMEYFGLTHIPAAVNNAITVSKILGNFLAAGIFVKLLPKKAMGFAMALLVLVGAGAFTTSFPIYIFSRFLMGFGGALVVVYFSPVVIFYFPPEKRALLNGLNTIAGPTGNVIGLMAAVPLTSLFAGNWKLTVITFSLCSLIIFILWIICGQDFSVTPKAGITEKYGYKEGLRDPFNYIFALTYGGWLILMMFMGNLYYLNPNAPSNAAAVSWLIPLGGMISTPFAIVAVKKLKRRLPIIHICGAAYSVLALLIMTVKDPAIITVIALMMGIAAFLPITSFITIPQELPNMNPQKLSVIMALYWSFSYLFETVMYTILTAIINCWGFAFPKYAVVALSLMFCFVSFLLPETGPGKKKPLASRQKA
ncbi:MAG: MFS transporter [Clostridia bacterium]|nr:MFS transporter [Clostridia bacterium]